MSRPATVSKVCSIGVPPVLPSCDDAASPAGRCGPGRPPVATMDGVTAGIPELPGGSVPVLAALRGLLPGGGLARGSVVCADQPGMLCAALLAGASRAGLWCAVAGLPQFGVVAAANAGARPDRLMLVPDPGARWPEVAAVLLDACDVVLLGVAGHVPARIRAQLETRARAAGSVLIAAGRWTAPRCGCRSCSGSGRASATGTAGWPPAAPRCGAHGRGLASRPRYAWLWLPGPGGVVTAAEPGERPAGDAWRSAGAG